MNNSKLFRALVCIALALAVVGLFTPRDLGEPLSPFAYQTKVYLTSGGDKAVVASGGEIETQSGGTVDMQSGTVTNIAVNPIFEGATADDYETTLAITDPTADRTVTLADATGTVMLSSLATNAPDVANSVYGASNALTYEGATANDFETSLSATDPTADRSVVFADGAGTIVLSSLATNATDAANAVTGASNAWVWEGATANDFETSLTVTDPTADNTVTIPDDTGSLLVFENANTQDVDVIFEGATSNDFEQTWTVTDPTADTTVTFPDGSGTVMLSSLATNAVDIANSVTGASNGLTYEGATANDFETTLSVTDPTADRSVVFADGAGTVVLSSLATNATDAANAVTGASNAWVWEGATANDFETSVVATDPTADHTVTLADAAGTVVLSSLATNAPEAASSVFGASNAWVFEGLTANDFETSVSPADPTADRTATLPDLSGTFLLQQAVAVAGSGGDLVDVTATFNAMDGGDISLGLDMNLTGANATGTTNLLYGMDLDLTTADAQVTEKAIDLNDSDWDYAIDTGHVPIVCTAATWMDDFFGDTIRAEWVLLNGSDPQALDPAIVANAQYGEAVLVSGDADTGCAADCSEMNMGTSWSADQGSLVFEVRVRIHTTVTNASLCVGLTDVATIEAPASITTTDTVTYVADDFVAFCFDDAADTDEWFALGRAGTTAATGNGATGVAPTADVYQVLRIEVDAGGADARFYIDGSLVKTLTADVITVTDLLAPFVTVDTNATSSVTVYVDYLFVSAQRS